MNASRPFTWIASAIFALMALVHIYRLIKPFEVTIGSCHLPQWASIVGAAVAGVLSWMLCREARGTTGP
jgi:uncharacterized integral membrane protein